MAHISQRKMRTKSSLRIKRNFIAAAIKDRGLVIESLLTPTETLMLAKRLAVIAALERGTPARAISRSLQVSLSSVQRYERMLAAKLFKPIIRRVRKNDRTMSEMFELVLALGMPSIAGPEGTKRLNKIRRGDIGGGRGD